MLVLHRKDGQDIIVIHNESGDQFSFRISNITNHQMDFSFKDPDFKFTFYRAEKVNDPKSKLPPKKGKP